MTIGIVGDPTYPTSLVLAMPTPDQEWATAGATTVLSKAVAPSTAALVELIGQTSGGSFGVTPARCSSARFGRWWSRSTLTPPWTPRCFDMERDFFELDPILT